MATMDELFDGSNAHLMTHVVPVGDLREHITDGECWCNPSVDDDLVVIHNSMDERESYEERANLAEQIAALTSRCNRMKAL